MELRGRVAQFSPNGCRGPRRPSTWACDSLKFVPLQACDAWHHLPWRCQHSICQWQKREVGNLNHRRHCNLSKSWYNIRSPLAMLLTMMMLMVMMVAVMMVVAMMMMRMMIIVMVVMMMMMTVMVVMIQNRMVMIMMVDHMRTNTNSRLLRRTFQPPDTLLTSHVIERSTFHPSNQTKHPLLGLH